MLPLIMAAAGLLQQKEKNAQADRNRLLNAQTQALSPWTHMTANNDMTKSSPLAAGMEGYLGGAAGAQNLAKGAAEQGMAKSKWDAFDKMDLDTKARIMGGGDKTEFGKNV